MGTFRDCLRPMKTARQQQGDDSSVSSYVFNRYFAASVVSRNCHPPNEDQTPREGDRAQIN